MLFEVSVLDCIFYDLKYIIRKAGYTLDNYKSCLYSTVVNIETRIGFFIHLSDSELVSIV